MNQAVAGWTVRLAAVLVGLAGASVVAFGLVFVADDLATRGEMFDGLGAFLGLVVCAGGGILVGVAALVAWLVRRRPFEAAVVICALGVLVAGAGWVAVASVGVLVSAPMVLGGVFIGGLGFGAALGAPRVAIDSPGGNSP